MFKYKDKSFKDAHLGNLQFRSRILQVKVLSSLACTLKYKHTHAHFFITFKVFPNILGPNVPSLLMLCSMLPTSGHHSAP